jgi:hypothetical protein
MTADFDGSSDDGKKRISTLVTRLKQTVMMSNMQLIVVNNSTSFLTPHDTCYLQLPAAYLHTPGSPFQSNRSVLHGTLPSVRRQFSSCTAHNLIFKHSNPPQTEDSPHNCSLHFFLTFAFLWFTGVMMVEYLQYRMSKILIISSLHAYFETGSRNFICKFCELILRTSLIRWKSYLYITDYWLYPRQKTWH